MSKNSKNSFIFSEFKNKGKLLKQIDRILLNGNGIECVRI